MCSPSLLKSERCQTLGKSHIKIFPTTTPTFCSFFTAPPIFLVEPSNQKVAEGAPASFDCIAGIFLQFYSNKKSTWIQIQILFFTILWHFLFIFCISAGNPTPTLFWIKESSPGIYLPATTHGHVTVTPEGTLRIGKDICLENDSMAFNSKAQRSFFITFLKPHAPLKKASKFDFSYNFFFANVGNV